MRRTTLLLPIVLIALLFVGPGSARANFTYLHFTSTPGSWIGQGQTLTFDTVTTFRYHNQGAYTNAVVLSGGGYTLDLVEPNYTLPTVGYFDSVTRWPFMGTGAGMWFTAPGRGDNQIHGWFDVLEATYSPTDGSVMSFAVDFRQYDENSTTEYTEGSIRYNSVFGPAVPEPSSAALVLAGAVTLFVARQVRRTRLGRS